MARLARVEVFASDEVAIVHVLNRTVRRCFLLGNDPISGKKDRKSTRLNSSHGMSSRMPSSA